MGIFFGALLICGGLLMCSFIHELHIWFLTYSAVIGLGEGVLFMAVVEMIYSKSPTALRGFMMGFASGGMFLGISIFGPVLLALESWTDDLWNSIVRPISSSQKLILNAFRLIYTSNLQN